MCIMEVRPGQHDSTIAQANAHNINTVIGDLELWLPVLTTRAERSADGNDRRYNETVIATVTRTHDVLTTQYAAMLGLFGSEVAAAVEHWQHDHGPIGAERDHHHGDDHVTLVAAAHRDARLARGYETR